MLEWRPIEVSSALKAVMFGSQGAFGSYIPNCTVQGAVAACTEFWDVSRDVAASESTPVVIANAHTKRNRLSNKVNPLLPPRSPPPQLPHVYHTLSPHPPS